MNEWTIFLIFPAVGAVIGAVTNRLAIRMLFRPYQSWYLGKLRVPFTPGLIPAERKKIAENIATTVQANLISDLDIHKLLTQDTVKNAINKKIDEFLADLGPFGGMLGGVKPKIMEKITAALEEVVQEVTADSNTFSVEDKIKDRIDAMDTSRLEELVMGFSQKQFRYITFFGGILGALIGLIQACISLPLG